jgi:uncharacterized repeat protein (TIGR02543 family)
MAKLSVTPSFITVNVGETFTITLFLQATEEVHAYQVALCWNPNIIECITKLPTSFFPAFPIQPPESPNNVEGWLAAAAILPERRYVTGTGDILAITFRAKAAGKTPIRFCKVNGWTTVLVDPDGNPIPLTTEDGTVIVATTSLSGKVTDARTGLPVEDVTITLKSAEKSYTTTTDADGNYTITLPSDIYTLTASKTGYETHTQTVDLTVPTAPPGEYTKNIALKPTHKLTVDSEPIKGAPFTIDTKTAITPYSETLGEGTYIITMPPEITDPATGYTYRYAGMEWDGNTTVEPSLTFTLDRDITVIAHYKLVEQRLTVLSDPIPVPVTINGQPAGYTPLEMTIPKGASVTVEVPPEINNYTFNQYTLDTTTSKLNPITFTMDRDYTLTAHFQPTQYLTITVTPLEGGTTNPPPGQHPYPKNSTVTVTAIPASGYEFDYWTLNGEVKTENPITITMDKDYTLTAHFKPIPPPPTSTVRGRVTGLFGHPIAGAKITLNTYTTTTDADGNYVIPEVAEATYVLMVVPPTPLTLIYNTHTQPIKIEGGKTYTKDVQLTVKPLPLITAAGIILGPATYILWRQLKPPKKG